MGETGSGVRRQGEKETSKLHGLRKDAAVWAISGFPSGGGS